MTDRITNEQLGRLQAALNSRIQRLESLRPLLHLTDPAVLEAGLELFEDEAPLVDWLTEPAVSMGGEIPLRLMAAEEGRQLVATALRRILHGVY